MKLAKKFLSVAAVLAMGTCVYTVPVFAEEPEQTSDVPITAVEETTDDIAVINEVGEGDGSGSNGDDQEKPNQPDSIVLTDYITYSSDSITYKSASNQIQVKMTIKEGLPANLIYELSWADSGKSLSSPTATLAGQPLTITTGWLTSDENGVIEEKAGVSDEGLDGTSFEDEVGSVNIVGSKISIEKNAINKAFQDSDGKATDGKELILTYNLQPNSNKLKLKSKIYLAGHENENNKDEVGFVDKTFNIDIDGLTEYVYDSTYDQTNNTLTLTVALPEEVYNENEENLYLSIYATYPTGVTSDAPILKKIRNVKIGDEEIRESDFNKNYVKKILNIPSLEDTPLGIDLPNTYFLEIPYKDLNQYMDLENSKVTIVLDTVENPLNANVYAYAATLSLHEKKGYETTLKKETDYNITGVYNASLNTWTVGVQPASSSLANTEAETTITITSNPNIMTKLDSLVIGSEEVIKNATGESTDKTTQSSEDSSTASSEDSSATSSEDSTDSTEPSSSNEVGEESVASLTPITNGYQIKVKNADLQGLKDSDWIKAQFSVEKNFDTSKMEVTAESGTYKSETYEKEIKAEVGDTNNATFKGSHDYDSSKQTWTVNLAMTGRPDKLDLTFTQTEGTALGKPTSITVDGKAVAPTVNTKMSGSTMSECTVDFRKEDLDLIKADSKVTLVFPIDGSKEQSERILMNVDLGSSSKDLSAKFTVKKSTGTPSSSSNVNTATETNMNTIIIVMVVALAAFAIFGVLAFKKKKTK